MMQPFGLVHVVRTLRTGDSADGGVVDAEALR
jgi:hypothetical protein